MVDKSLEIQKPWRILAVEHGKISAAIIKSLKNNFLADSGCLVHVGGRKSDLNISSLLRMSNTKSRTGHIMENDRFFNAGSELVASADFEDALLAGLDNLERRSLEFKYNHHYIQGFHDSQHYYQIVVDVLTNILLLKQINLILFFDVPHLFYDTILYQVAKVSGIRTLIFKQSIFSNKFYSLKSIDDCGKLPPIPEDYSANDYEIDSNKTPNWYYMRNIEQERGKLGHLTVRGVFHLFLHLLTSNPLQLLRPIFIIKVMRRMHRVSSAFPLWRDPFSSFFHLKQISYFESLAKFENSEIEFADNFVYFPLQLQPELTTSSLGGKFSDQLMAIERLSTIVPKDCFIYVKENPKQTGRMRGEMFFQRLWRIPNLKFLPSYANTHELTDRAIFVATVTGTVGWEAICKGKKVLVFGKPWYRKLPGVIEYHEEIKFADICNLIFEHATLEHHASWLVSRMHTGVISRAAARQKEDFSKEFSAHVHTAAKTIHEVVEGGENTTFC